MYKIIESWLHSQKENDKSVLEVLNDPTKRNFYFTSGDFKIIGSHVTNLCRITEVLNEYFKTYNLPFEARHKQGEWRGSIIKTKFPYSHPFVSRIEKKEYPNDIFIKDEDRETRERQKKRIEEERKASRDR